MYLYFNKDGILTTQIEHDLPPIRQGSTFTIFVYFDNDFDVSNKTITIQFKKPGENSFQDETYMEYVGLKEFTKLNPKEITYDLKDGVFYNVFQFDSTNDGQLSSKYGNAYFLITVYEVDKNNDVIDVYTQGLVSTYIEKTYGDALPNTVTRDQYNYLLANLGNKQDRITDDDKIEVNLNDFNAGSGGTGGTGSSGGSYDDTALRNLLSSHIENQENPHNVTKEKIGLGNVNNVAITSEQVEQIELNEEKINEHIDDFSNPHKVTKEQIGLGNVNNVAITEEQILQIATNKNNIEKLQEDILNNDQIPTKTSDLINDSGFINKDVQNLSNYELKTNTGSLLDVSII